MHIRSVEFPDRLVEAHREGRLVLFVGAGASRDDPSSLPDFKGLTRSILEAGAAEDLLERLERDEPLDTLLGALDERDVDVHRLVAELLDPPGSQPNVLHHAIASVAGAGRDVRVVTTNYDRHLSTALETAGVHADEYTAPALPMGNDFEGLVYLHGSLNQDPRHLVVTDQDFGRAYLRDAWAARFLERMYDEFLVLFIGYSHGDVVLRYLARSLSSAKPRFLLTDQPDDGDWRTLGIVPIGYDLIDESHDRLPEALEAWAAEASRGLLDHRHRVRELVTAAPTGVPEHESYLEATLADPDRVRFFAEFAEHDQWLPWAAQRPQFRQLFDARAELGPANSTLGQWFVERFVLSEERTAGALSTVREAGGKLSPHLWGILAQAVWTADTRPAWLGPWLVLLVEQAPPGGLDLLEYLLSDMQMPNDRAEALLLFERLTQPKVALDVSLFDQEPRMKVEIPGHHHWLHEAWTKQLMPALPAIAPDILSIADRHLRRAYELLVAASGDRRPFDGLSYSRSAIRSHPQDEYPEPFDALLDAARDSLEAALDANLPIAVGYLDSWSSTTAPVLRRLAVHGMTHRSDVTASDKVVWLLDRDLLFDTESRPEVFELLNRTAADLDDDVGAWLVSEIREAPDEGDDELRDRVRYDRLAWLLDVAPELPGARALLEDVQSRHPEWRPSDHPDLRFVMETSWHPPSPPMTADELHDELRKDPHAVLDKLGSYQDAESGSSTALRDVLDLIAGTVREHPSDGATLIEAAGDSATAIASAVIRGWSRAELSDDSAEVVLARLRELNLSDLVHVVADLLASGGQQEGFPTEWFRFDAARELADDVWGVLNHHPSATSTDDWLVRAINHPAGKLAQFWIRAVASDWKAAGDSWSGLHQDLASPLERMLESGSSSTAMVEPVVASKLRFFHEADSDWALRHVLPLFDWDTPDRALRAWHGFLCWGRPTEPLLEAGLLDQYLNLAAHADQLSDELRRQLAKHLAGIATSRDPAPGAWLGRFTAIADETLRAEWISAIRWMVRDLPVDEVARQWTGWIKPYWEGRLRTVPVALTVKEASAFASWLPHLGSVMGEAVELLLRQPASLDGNPLTLRDFADAGDLLDSQPQQIATALAHLLEHTTGRFHDCGTLRDLFHRLASEADQDSLTRVREHAIRLGCDGAAEW